MKLIDGAMNEFEYDGVNLPELCEGELDALRYMEMEGGQCSVIRLQNELDGFDDEIAETSFLESLGLIVWWPFGICTLTDAGRAALKAVSHD